MLVLAWRFRKLIVLAALGLVVAFVGGSAMYAASVQPGYVQVSQDTCTTNPTGTLDPVKVTSAADLTDEQLRNAALMISIGRQLHVDSYGWVVAISAAMQESKLRNIDYGDIMANGQMSTSRGLFQMIASTAAAAGVSNMDPAADIRWFYATLTAVPNWQRLTVAQAAESVEHSGVPDAYAKWQTMAEQVVRSAHVAGGSGRPRSSPEAASVCPGQLPGVAVTASGKVKVAITAALAERGLPYCWGGGGVDGPTEGIPTNGPNPDPQTGLSPGCSTSTPGFDCSGLVNYAYGKAGVALPRTTAGLIGVGTAVPAGQLQPGDLVFPDPGHVQIYLGHGQVVEAPEDGLKVRVWHLSGVWGARRVA